MYLDVSEPEKILKRNPQLRSIISIKRFYEENGEEWGDRVIHAVYLVHDPLSPYRRTPTQISSKKLRAQVKKDLFEGDDFSKLNWFDIQNIEKAYKQQVPKEVKELDKLFVKLTEYQEYIDELSPPTMSLKNIREEIKALKEAWEDYFELKRKCLDSGQEKSAGYGGTHQNILV